MTLLLRTVLGAVALWVAVLVVGGLDFVGSPVQLLLLALLMGVINAVVRPVVKLLSLPLVILTLGLFLVVINILLFGLLVALAEPLGLGLSSDGLLSTAFGALITSLVVAVGQRLLPE